jgi:hypothetical protein
MRAALAAAILLVLPLPALAQARRHVVTFVYEVSAGAGGRTTAGLLLAPPAGALQPASGRMTGTVGVDAGVRLSKRFAVMGIWDGTAGGNAGAGYWGTMGMYGVARVWPTRRIWLEGGGGLTELGYQPPSQISVTVTRFWAPAAESAAGVEIFRGPNVGISVFARYSTATFDGLAVHNLSVQIGLLGQLWPH